MSSRPVHNATGLKNGIQILAPLEEHGTSFKKNSKYTTLLTKTTRTKAEKPHAVAFRRSR